MTAHLRPLDHLVLPVGDLHVAEARYAALGFQVAPRGQHPFGTENACVYLADGTFLEPLAVADEERASEAVKSGNVFVGHDKTFRTRVGQDGLSALVLGTQDASADDARFRADAVSRGDMLRFSRPFVGFDGTSGEASFLLAFAGDLRAPDALFFTCERIGVPAVDRTPLTRHANGVTTLRRVILVAPEPHHFEMLLTTLMDHADPVRSDDAIDLQTGTSTISVLTPAAAHALLGDARWDEADPTLQFAAIEFGVQDLSATRTHLEAGGMVVETAGSSLRVDAAAGQGVPFLFTEARS
ncbi:VOC family protein [Tianweitania sp. BSSL-BM11]|uniref:VOC family protein n=1 Tax=Tianweitania aestuarii TaxID=2814886 RepID=A0ABS5RTP1_9HYPH|nr:VOC family protein [Tianweitania aestuarii]MBS9720428.1 VOC family protein [Tianweitania aestuarii]